MFFQFRFTIIENFFQFQFSIAENFVSVSVHNVIQLSYNFQAFGEFPSLGV